MYFIFKEKLKCFTRIALPYYPSTAPSTVFAIHCLTTSLSTNHAGKITSECAGPHHAHDDPVGKNSSHCLPARGGQHSFNCPGACNEFINYANELTRAGRKATPVHTWGTTTIRQHFALQHLSGSLTCFSVLFATSCMCKMNENRTVRTVR